MSKNIKSDFLENLKRLNKTKCWGAFAGEGTGSNFSLSFGEKKLRKKELKNKHLSEKGRKYEPELSLFVTCSWRLDSETSILCSSKENNSNTGSMVRSLKKVIGKRVMDINVFEPAFDLIITFDGGLSLKIFCDETDPDEDFDNYCFFYKDKTYAVINRSELFFEEK